MRVKNLEGIADAEIIFSGYQGQFTSGFCQPSISGITRGEKLLPHLLMYNPFNNIVTLSPS